MKTSSLKDRWILFAKILLDPWIIALAISTVVIINISNQQSSESVKSLLNILISLFSGLLGGIVSKRWSDYNDEKVIIARGTTAIRSLKLLLLNIAAVESRVKEYILRLNKTYPDYELVKNSFEEVIEKCNIIEEEGLSSIENWTDIIPDANIKTQIGSLTEMKNEKTKLELQLSEMNKQLTDDKKINEKEKDVLKSQISSKENELKKVRADLAEKEKKLNNSVLSGLNIVSGSYLGKIIDSNYYGNVELNPPAYKIIGGASAINPLYKSKCKKCGKELDRVFVSTSDNNICDDCKKKTK